MNSTPKPDFVQAQVIINYLISTSIQRKPKKTNYISIMGLISMYRGNNIINSISKLIILLVNECKKGSYCNTTQI